MSVTAAGNRLQSRTSAHVSLHNNLTTALHNLDPEITSVHDVPLEGKELSVQCSVVSAEVSVDD